MRARQRREQRAEFERELNELRRVFLENDPEAIHWFMRRLSGAPGLYAM
jgi:hypothetical protein